MKFKKTSFWKTKELISKNRKKSAYILSLDVLFFLLIFFLSKMISPDPYAIYNLQISAIIIFIIIYSAFLLFFYSLTKYVILLIIKSMHEKAEFKLKNYFRFAALNTAIAAIILIGVTIFSLLINLTVKQENLALVSAIFLCAITIISYLYANIAHMSFVINNRIGKAIKDAFRVLFKQAAQYLPLLLNLLVFAVAYTLISFAITPIIGAKNIFVYKNIFMSIAAVLLYTVLFLNRFYLFCKIDMSEFSTR